MPLLLYTAVGFLLSPLPFLVIGVAEAAGKRRTALLVVFAATLLLAIAIALFTPAADNGTHAFTIPVSTWPFAICASGVALCITELATRFSLARGARLRTFFIAFATLFWVAACIWPLPLFVIIPFRPQLLEPVDD